MTLVHLPAVHPVLMGGMGRMMVCVVGWVKHVRFCLGHLNSPPPRLLKAFACDPSAPSNSGKVNPDYKASGAIGSHAGGCAPETNGLRDCHEHRTGFESLGHF